MNKKIKEFYGNELLMSEKEKQEELNKINKNIKNENAH